ncbi:CPBP family intramembrane glutamic endopeptidase [Amphibacillus cookii]|uniref:CPBP family intramembrane glutamic endopeptidase n=1 Tax=Amphibacillus cookii TaxID=767787 RepID=UPI001956237B|nr:CPBP family intramembrane glutamic endopeptidase [Amphibacillus cookii]MBM7542495.1 membrane protease YdiL (CAAX protease family) [Amphibacillus cookii]
MNGFREIVEQLSAKQLRQAVYFTQLIITGCAGLLTIFYSYRGVEFSKFITFDWIELFYFSFIPAVIILTIDLLLYHYLPDKYLDDQGVNKKVFKDITLCELLLITAWIAIAEEWLFRLVIQSQFGIVVTMLTFIFLHTRYLKQPLLLINISCLSLGLSLIMELTGNILTVIVLHFLIDFGLGLYIRKA